MVGTAQHRASASVTRPNAIYKVASGRRTDIAAVLDQILLEFIDENDGGPGGFASQPSRSQKNRWPPARAALDAFSGHSSRASAPYFNEIRRALHVRPTVISAKKADIWHGSISAIVSRPPWPRRAVNPALQGWRFHPHRSCVCAIRYARVRRREWGRAQNSISSRYETPAIDLKRDR